jgi:hypothetical protein
MPRHPIQPLTPHTPVPLRDGISMAGRGGDATIYFVLGQQPFGQFPKGWDLALVGMCVGEKRTVKVPPVLAYGPKVRSLEEGGIMGGLMIMFMVIRGMERSSTLSLCVSRGWTMSQAGHSFLGVCHVAVCAGPEEARHPARQPDHLRCGAHWHQRDQPAQMTMAGECRAKCCFVLFLER